MRDGEEIGVAHITPAYIRFQRAVAGGVKPDGYVEFFQCTPQWLAHLIMQVLAVHGVRRADHRHGAQFLHTTLGLFHRKADIVHGDLCGKFQSLWIVLAIIRRPVVVGARQRCRVVRR